MKRSKPLAQHSSSQTARCKERIQELCRRIAILRDGGCILRDRHDIGPCSGRNKADGLIYQYDHLVTRARNISYGDTRLGVCLCLGHHGGFKKWHKPRYDAIIRELISPERVVLWDRVEAERKSYTYVLYDWLKVETSLIQELKEYATN